MQKESQRAKPVSNFSQFFYAWGEPGYILLLLVSVASNYLIGFALGSFDRAGMPSSYSKCLLAAGIAANIALLVYFKYLGFFLSALSKLVPSLSQLAISSSSIVLPIGISFFTFHAISYLVDVYRRRIIPQTNVTILILYITFYPQLLAGPIVRYHQIANQFLHRKMNWTSAAQGISRFIVGLSKKVLLADQFAVLSDKVFQLPAESLTLTVAWAGALAFTFQIYYDFSGYSDMACGLAKIFGFNFPENFNYPYSSQSIKDFWRRWHMSLSAFFRDYVYLPMGGNQHGRVREYINLSTVFILCGFWHGANWTFIIWGVYHGAFLCLERTVVARVLNTMPAVLKHTYAMLVVILGWVIFRSQDFPSALSFLAAMFGHRSSSFHYPLQALVTGKVLFCFFLALAFATPVLRNFLFRFSIESRRRLRVLLPFLRSFTMAGTLALFGLCISALTASAVQPFLYFRF